MYLLIDLFANICLLRKGPQHVPLSPVLLRLTLIVYALAALITLVSITDLLSALLQTVADVGLLIALTWAVLAGFGHRQRLVQTLTALAGAGAILWLLSLPNALWIAQASAQSEEARLPVLLQQLIVVWDIVIKGHILRCAIDIDLWLGVLWALGIFFVTNMMLSLLFALT